MAVCGRKAFIDEDQAEVTQLVLDYIARCEELEREPLLAEVARDLNVSEQTLIQYRKRGGWMAELLELVDRHQYAGLMRALLNDKRYRGASFILNVKHKLVPTKLIETKDGDLAEQIAAARRRAQASLPAEDDAEDDEGE